ncbi:hypothetical protein [Shewanella sp. Arc9-LZ]|jgi:hypothetical protein|uniref:hypothetical protein n=2 Tax=unclassified Shewanella TaxID=196818 RepID=UPI00137C1627|nr:hypothetical protein [Shewanella sp. Arc9-LZ]QHS15138.1 hypothetical protein GUY17_19530 [Shewanella sp. Arc9-LZ]
MKKKSTNAKSMVIVSDVDNYDFKDNRVLKPLLLNCSEHPEYPMNHAFQHSDSVKLTKKKTLEYFVPNNISLLLSNSRTALNDAEKMYKEFLLEQQDEFKEDKIDELWHNCFLVSNYIEKIQTSIVFSYTALEAFANISIPDDFVYISQRNNKGIKEQFERQAIERWLSLKDKLDSVLPQIYDCNTISKQNFWSQFLQLEDYRNKIIHQKAIESTSFFYEYFKPSIFKVLRVAENIICYFHDVNKVNTSEQAQANLMWPWLPGAMTAPVLRNPESILDWKVDHNQPSFKKRFSDRQLAEFDKLSNQNSQINKLHNE